MAAKLGSSAPAAHVFELPEVLDLRAAAPLVTELLARRGKDLGVDASRVEKLGGQCLQVLLSAAMTWAADEIPFAVVDPSPEFVESLDRLGIAASDLIEQDPTR